MNRIFFFLFITLSSIIYFLSLFSCGNRNPNLSDKQLLTLANDTAQNNFEFQSIVAADTSCIPTKGIKFVENRSIDPAFPPIPIDIAENLNQKTRFKLSDFASSVHYIRIMPPKGEKFLFIFDIAFGDQSMYINTPAGIFHYSADGKYMSTICNNQIEKEHFYFSKGSIGNIDLLNGLLMYRDIEYSSGDRDILKLFLQILDTQSSTIRHTIKLNLKKEGGRDCTYQFIDKQSLFLAPSWISTNLHGDTLCRFSDNEKPSASTLFKNNSENSKLYRFGKQLTLRKAYNDTIFRIPEPNRLLPVYTLQWGKYKATVDESVIGSDMDGKFILQDLVETPRFIFFNYSEGRNYPGRHEKVKYQWCIYNKTTHEIKHHITEVPYFVQPIIENNIDQLGMPFWPQGTTHKDKMYMIFSKEEIQRYISSLPHFKNKLQMIAKDMQDDDFFLMIVD